MRPLIKIRSFRIRIAVLSVLMSGTVLAAFGLWAWVIFQRVNLQRIDQEIGKYGHRLLVGHQQPWRWERVVGSMQFFLGDEDSTAFLLLVKGRDNSVLHISENWPEDLSTDIFPAPTDGADSSMEPGQHLAEDAADARLDPSDAGPPGMRRFPPPRAVERELPPPPFGPFGPRPRRWRWREEGWPLRGPEMLPTRPLLFVTQRAGGRQWRLGLLGNPDVTVVLGFNMNQFNAETLQLRNAFLIVSMGALLLIAAGGWWISQRALRPVKTLTQAAEAITVTGLDQRIPSGHEDVEFMRLISVFNQMMDRLEKSFYQATRFSADAAHELNTPLTILQGELEHALQSAELGSGQQQEYGTLLEEVQRLKTIIRKLLLLSLADSGKLKLNLEPVNISETLEAVCEDIEILAPHLAVEKFIDSDVWVMADADLIRQVIQNLTNNAIKYNHDGGSIALRLRSEGPVVTFTVSNSGRSIPREDRDRIFDRFYRGDKARSRQVDGFGLGLSLAREIARAHRGNLVLEDTADGITTFTLALPRRQVLRG